jgi:hypothetical protein
MDVLGEEGKNKDVPPQLTIPPIVADSLISREEHLASLNTLQSSMRLEMQAVFEEYFGKKPAGLIDPSTTPNVDLTVARAKLSNNGSPSMENNGALPKENDGSAKGASVPPPNTYSTLPVHY